jgi:hypothetical protein
MSQNTHHLPKLSELPVSLSEGAISIALSEGIASFRASAKVIRRIETLLEKAKTGSLSSREAAELERYEEIDDYLSQLNRVVRNLQLT